LERFLPSNLLIGTGQIVDNEGSKSNQIDIVIYRRDFPVLRTFGAADVYLVEGVVATIEIKSTLDSDKLLMALNNGKSVRNLKAAVLQGSFDRYSRLAFGKGVEELDRAKTNSLIGMILPPVFILGYQGYRAGSASHLIEAINKWHTSDEDGQKDVSLLPEAIVTHGCVGMKNLNNSLGLLDPSFGYGVKGDPTPLRFFISSLLETIFGRIGHQQLGQTGIQFNLTRYHLSADMEGKWLGAAKNSLGVVDPRLCMIDRLQKGEIDERNLV
jgi:hypothetical protein